jgi:hypothetical protein
MLNVGAILRLAVEFLRDLRQLLVGRFLFFECFLEEIGYFRLTEALGVKPDSAIATIS